MTRRFRLIFASACAVLAVLLSIAYGDHVRQEAERVRSDAIARFGGEVAQLVVADDALEPGDVISEANVSMRDWLADLAPADAYTALEDVIGREVTVALAKGSPLTDLTFRDDSTLSDVPEGHVAVSIPVNERLGMASNVAQGSRVLAYRVESDGVRLIASDLQVLSSPAAQASLSASQQVTLAVLPDDVALVLAASSSGDLRLVLPAAGLEADAVAELLPEDVASPPEQADVPEGMSGEAEGEPAPETWSEEGDPAGAQTDGATDEADEGTEASAETADTPGEQESPSEPTEPDSQDTPASNEEQAVTTDNEAKEADES